MAMVAEQLGRKAQFCHPNLAVDFGTPGQVHNNKFGVQQSGCTYYGECDIGCKERAKNTLDLNYLALAEQRNAEVGTRCEVFAIVPAADGGYHVHYRDHGANGREQSSYAQRVFLCAGAVNSTELLLRCRDDHKSLPRLSSALGHGYSGNGDFLAFAFDTKQAYEPSNGPTITTALVYDAGEGDQRSWFTLQDGGYPKEISSLFQALRPGSGWLKGVNTAARDELERRVRAAAGEQVGKLTEYPKSAVFLAMGRDRADGRIDLHPLTRCLRIAWNLADNVPLYGAESRLVDDVVEKLGGQPANNPFWERFHQPVSVHNLGGCRMADDAAHGVTDNEGQVHGYPGLYVLDGAILPASTGVNPSHTIAAVAERNIERVIRRVRKDAWQAPERAKATKVICPISQISIPKGGTLPTRKLPVGLAFTETMKGFFVKANAVPASIADYVAAEKAGERADSRVEFTLTITMTDLDRFISDPAHTGLAVGKVLAQGITPGDGSDVTTGVFNLFTQTGQFHERKMLYALPFVGSDRREYLLDGYKEVKDHGSFDVWGSTSTLYTVIRAGHSHQGEVVAAGVLHILIPDFLHQLTTFVAPGAENAAASVEAIARFGKLFMGSLWEVFGASKL
ncbi:MAG: hypothetical protein RL701_6884 [Pseudomonadota bacterium]